MKMPIRSLPLAALAAALGLGLACAGAGALPGTAAPPGTGPTAPPPPPAHDVTTLSYTPGPHGVEDAGFSAWERGDILYVGADDANLRAEPLVNGAVVATLPLGARVEVIESGAPEVQISRRNAWVRVRAEAGEGWVFGAILSPLSAQVTGWDTEQPVTAVVTFSPDFRPRVRIGGPRDVQTFDLEASKGVGGVLKVRTVPWGRYQALRVTRCDDRGQDCEDLDVRRAERWVQGRTGDDPRCPAAEVFPVRASEPRLVHEATFETVEREPSRDVLCWDLGRLAQGRLVSCVQNNEDKVGLVRDGFDRVVLTRFLSAKGTWQPLPCASDGVDEIESILRDRGVKIGAPDPTIALSSPYAPPRRIEAGERGDLERIDRVDAWGHGDLVYEAPGVGSLYQSPWGGSALVLEAPEKLNESNGQTVRYVYRYAPSKRTLERRGTEVRTSAYVCGREWAPALVEGFDPSGLSPVDRLGAAPVYQHGDELVALDSWDRPYALLPDGPSPHDTNGCEPVIYLYADPPRTFRVRVGAPVPVSIPPHGPEGWLVRAGPDGTLWIRGEPTEDLFWEGPLPELLPPDTAFVVPGTEAEPFLRTIGERLGLAERELGPFVAAWAPELATNAWSRVGVYPRAEIDRAAPLEIEPPPDTVIRVLLDIAPLRVPVGGAPPRLPEPILEPPPARRGTVLVEWGAVWRELRPIAR